MSAKQVKDILTREWKRGATKKTDWPTTQREFFDFLQVSRSELLTTHFTLYEDLPGLQQRGIVSLGGKVRFLGTSIQKYSWEYLFTKTGDNYQAGETVSAFGKTRQEAALRTLLVLWELIVRRKQWE